jgi:hypothetical protein
MTTPTTNNDPLACVVARLESYEKDGFTKIRYVGGKPFVQGGGAGYAHFDKDAAERIVRLWNGDSDAAAMRDALAGLMAVYDEGGAGNNYWSEEEPLWEAARNALQRGAGDGR